MKYEIYGFIHKIAKRVLKQNNDLSNKVKLISFPKDKAQNGVFPVEDAEYINEIETSSKSIHQSDVYPVENLVNRDFDSCYPFSFKNKDTILKFAPSLEKAASLWPQFIDASIIPMGYKNAGIHYAGYIKECQEWCLPSWIWTNAALVRCYCILGEINKAKDLGNLILAQQQECGGWIVRNDYTRTGVVPELAPNDSCYIALNCCLALYDVTNYKRYLDSAEATAKWVMETARPDGLVWFSYNMKTNEWTTNKNIVDIGFTAGLFARLYEITGKAKYLDFLKAFVKTYIKVFYNTDKKCFSTAIDENDRQHGGAFGRGQGWALEGLLPAYRVLKDESIKKVIDDTVETILEMQHKNGSWSYNLLKPLMGEDCKAVPVIARCLLEWYEMEKQDQRLIISARRALEWCAKHTAVNGIIAGGIFSYTIEGAIVHHMYTNTAFVYGSSYALEVKNKLDRLV